MSDKIEVNLVAFPQTLKMYKEDSLKSSAELTDGKKTAEEIVDQVESPFDAIRIKKIINMFEPEKITFKEKDEKRNN